MHPVPPPGRSKGLNVYAVTLIRLTQAEPVLFIVTPANVHDSVVAIPLLRAVQALYGFAIRIVRADAAYWNCAFLGFISEVLHATFVIDYNLFIIELASRRIVHFGVTRSLTDAWVAQQLREATPFGRVPRFLIRDRDRNASRGDALAQVVKGSKIEILKTPCRPPEANAISERFFGSARRECLDACGALQSCTAAPGN
ncbi:hypothetical protein ANRL2_03860 [Anaerolineae bacterium]|nr:hypothetical protein ANRL2_03860 [Anaerolineae bacterium]